ncbi:MAG: protein translocase subunit SecD [Clostridia bacterium]|nr:protein translocase subunit SecD [Clostridia bacterium]
MKRTPKAAFFIVAVLILLLCFTSFFGVYKQFGDRTDTVIRSLFDIRWGVDIQGGVEARFGPADQDVKPTEEQVDAVKAIIEKRLVAQNITDYEAYADKSSGEVIVSFPWASKNQTAESLVQDLGKTGMLKFYEGDGTTDDNGYDVPPEESKLVLDGNDVKSATAMVNQDTTTSAQSPYVIALELKSSGADKFAAATKKLAPTGKISIWLDFGEAWAKEKNQPRYTKLSAPTVEDPITGGEAVITGFAEYEDADEVADMINSGALPFSITDKSVNVISPTMGQNALSAMGIAGIIAMIAVCVLMICIYRLPGLVAAIALCGQMALTIACISGYFSFFPSFTMTLPGIAGLILSIGIGVDCNVITAESVRDELRAGKTIDGAIRAGSKNSFGAIFDGNITVFIVAAVLMGVFGSSDGIFGWLFSWLPVSTTGAVYAFGYTLLIGVITNFVMGMWLSRVMLRSISRLKVFRNPWFYGGERK